MSGDKQWRMRLLRRPDGVDPLYPAEEFRAIADVVRAQAPDVAATLDGILKAMEEIDDRLDAVEPLLEVVGAWGEEAVEKAVAEYRASPH